MKKLFVISHSHTFAQKLDVQKLIARLDNLDVGDYADIWWTMRFLQDQAGIKRSA